MKLSALFQKHPPARRRPVHAPSQPATIEPLEARIAPATLVNPTTVTFQDKNGDIATVTISKPLFTAASVAKVFTFDTGSVNGSNAAQQQLELLNITKLGQSAKGLDITITATPVAMSAGVVNVGYINAGGIDLGDVSIAGDLGRIAAGDLSLGTDGLHSLTVQSIGAQGIATQAAGGNLVTKISGPVASITVNGDINGADIGIGGGSKGLLGSLLVTGNINGSSTSFSGDIRTQGGITSIEVDGGIFGGLGSNSGVIGTSGALGTVLVKGAIVGGGGSFSGAILSTKSMQSIEINGALTGGAGEDSGEVGTAATLNTILVKGAVTGGTGELSGVILATANIASATLADGLAGGSGIGSGEIGAGGSVLSVSITGNMDHAGIESGANIGTVTITGSLLDGSEIHAHQNIQSLAVNSSGIAQGGIVRQISFTPGSGAGIIDSAILADNGSIGSISAGSDGSGAAISNASIAAGANIGPIQAVTDGGFAILNTEVFAGASLGDVTAVTDEGTAICNSQFHAVQGIGNIVADGTAAGFLNATFRAGAGIASITSGFDGSIMNSGFDAGGSIGPINSVETISGSVFVAGIDLGSGFSVTGAGTFNNTSAASFGFGSGATASSVAAHIGAITLGNSDASIQQSTFLAGVHGAGGDKVFGTRDDLVVTGSSIGAITAPSGLNTVWVESGDIGATVSGAILATTYISTDTALTAAGIGPITVTAGTPIITILPVGPEPAPIGNTVALTSQLSSTTGQAISGSSFISNAGIGAINVTLNGERTSGENGGIVNTTVLAGHLLGTITVVDNAFGSAGSNYGIINSTFNASLNGNGGVGDISVTLTDAGPDGNSAAISNVQINASMCNCTSATMGSISVENADTATTAAGIVNSVFRVRGNIGDISAIMDSGLTTAPAIEGTTFSTFSSIGDINVYGSIVGDANGPSRFLAGYDIGTGMTFGNQDLSAKSLALQGGQSVGNVTVTGFFEGSDIIASINPGSGYVFGDSTFTSVATNDSSVGTGGTIGLVTIGTNVQSQTNPFVLDHPTAHAIEAANFVSSDSPTVTAFGFTSGIPVVLFVDGGSNDVRITDLTQLT